MNLSIFSSDEFKKFASKLLLLFIVIVVIDQSLGSLFEHFYFKTREGDFGGRINLALEKKSDLYVIGNSRAQGHYVSNQLSDSLNISVFNAGLNGQNIFYHYGFLQLLLSVHKPQFILYNISSSDVFGSDIENFDKLAVLLPYHKNTAVMSLLKFRSPFETIKLLSRIYPYNSKAHSIIKFTLSPTSEKSSETMGYIPLNGVIHASHATDKIEEKTQYNKYQLSMKRMSIFKQFVNLCNTNRIKLVFIQSPEFNPSSIDTLPNPNFLVLDSIILEASKSEVIKITDKDFPVFQNPNLFKDTQHLNHQGAVIFTAYLASELKRLNIIKP